MNTYYVEEVRELREQVLAYGVPAESAQSARHLVEEVHAMSPDERTARQVPDAWSEEAMLAQQRAEQLLGGPVG